MPRRSLRPRRGSVTGRSTGWWGPGRRGPPGSRATPPVEGEPAPQGPGTRERWRERAIHESSLLSTGLLELDIEQYVGDFNERIIGAYAAGTGEQSLPADVGVARSLF